MGLLHVFCVMKSKLITLLKVVVFVVLSLIDIYPAILFLLCSCGWFSVNACNASYTPRKMHNMIARVVCLSVPAYVAIFLFYFGQWTHSLYVDKILVLSSIETLVLMLIPSLIYYIKNSFHRKIQKTTKKDYMILLLVAFPYLINDVLLFLNDYHRFFETASIINEILSALFFAAIIEELYFRVFLYQELKKMIKKTYLAQIVSSLIFTIWHIGLISNLVYSFSIEPLINMIYIFVVGMIASILYEKTGKLWVVTGFHAINNGIVLNCLTLVKNCVHHIPL